MSAAEARKPDAEYGRKPEAVLQYTDTRTETGAATPSAGRKFIPGGCVAVKPAPRTRTYIYITPSQGLGDCYVD